MKNIERKKFEALFKGYKVLLQSKVSAQ